MSACQLPAAGKPRDLYDIRLLMLGVEPDLALVDRRLALFDQRWKREALGEATENLRADWERDLHPLLPHFVPDEMVHGEVATCSTDC